MRVLSPRIDLAAFFEGAAHAPERVLMLDYDGTLAPFQVRPERAVPYPRVERLIDDIMKAEHSRVIIVSGRSVDDLARLLNLRRRPELWGADGRERLLPDGRGARIQPADALRVRLEEGARRARELVRLGVRVESKLGSVALHWRGASVLTTARMQNTLPRRWRPLAADGELELLPFDGGLELRARDRSKRRAAETVLSETLAGATLAYLGDDTTDEEAFRALKPRGLPVLVRAELRDTEARVWLRPPHELIAFLQRWRDVCNGAGAIGRGGTVGRR